MQKTKYAIIAGAALAAIIPLRANAAVVISYSFDSSM
jgi:hypothetical protein